MARRDLIGHLLPGRGLPLSLVERLSQESEGNPLYLVEAARGIIQSKQLIRQNGTWHLTRPDSQLELPQSIEGLMMASLDALDPPSRAILQHAAVIGSQFSYSLLATINPVENLDSGLVDLEQRGLIAALSNEDENTARTFVFTNKVMRKVAYQSILRKTRRELHSRIAQQTEAEIASSQEDLRKLAHHYAASGDQEKLVAYNWLVGQCALDEFKFEEACYHLQLAWHTLKEISNPNNEIYLSVANALGDASTFSGKFTEARTCYEAAKEFIEDKAGELAHLYYKLGRLYLYQANIETAQDYYEQALALASNNSSLKAQIETEVRLLYDA
jgi:predicted ATPase